MDLNSEEPGDRANLANQAEGQQHESEQQNVYEQEAGLHASADTHVTANLSTSNRNTLVLSSNSHVLFSILADWDPQFRPPCLIDAPLALSGSKDELNGLSTPSVAQGNQTGDASTSQGAIDHQQQDPPPPSDGSIRFQLIPVSNIPGRPIVGEVIERKLKDSQHMRLGRQVVRDGQTTVKGNKQPTEVDIWFTSKVVSRLHAEMWVKESQIYIKDIGSSSGTFLNKLRLSPSGKES
eukprot:jgi/Hompol1/2771/HPOL_002307-RA